MSFSLVIAFNPALVAAVAPPGTVLNLEVTVQAATATEMTAGVKRALLDVQQQNVGIVANPDLGPEFKLTLADATLSGGGDGHTFVTTLFFTPGSINALQAVLNELTNGSISDLSPEFFDFEFALAGTGAALPPLFVPIFQALCDASSAAQGSPAEEVLGIFNLNAGAAKGTRFMVGMGAIINQPVTTVVRNPVDATVPSLASSLKSLTALMNAKKMQPAGGASASSSMMNFLGLKR